MTETFFNDSSRRRKVIAQTVDEVIARRRNGEAVSDEEILDAHPELQPELGERLRALRRVDCAFDEADRQGSGTTVDSVQPRDLAVPLHANERVPLPGYEIQHEIHCGGQGVVYLATHCGTGRRVAVKFMRVGPITSRKNKARFDREIQILAQLKHPDIVTVHDSGTVAGRFYFVMEYVDGLPLDDYLALHEPPVEAVLHLFEKICSAVNAAHLRGVIHRDLKPRNILVDEAGAPHVLDFGLAKFAPEGSTELTRPFAMTVDGQFVGSLPWASPEQAAGQLDHIDVRSDVYSLGVMLYHALTGRFPYEVVGNMRDILDHILNTMPTPPSRVGANINDEIETIVLKCLSKESERRYQSAGELARDVKRYLAGEPVEAKRDSTWYVTKKLLRRHRASTAVAVSFVLLLALSSIVAWTLYTRSVRAHTEAQHERDRAVAARVQSREHLYIAHMNMAQHAWEQDRPRILRVHELLNAQFPLPGETDLRRFEWYYLWRMSHQERLVLRGHTAEVLDVAYAPDGRTIATASWDQTAKLWDVDTGAMLATFKGHTDAVSLAEFSPDGKTLATGSHDATIRLWNVASGETEMVLDGHKGGPQEVAFSPDGTRLVVATGNWSPKLAVRAVWMWDLTTGQLAFTNRQRYSVQGVVFSHDGQTFATADGDGTIRLWNPADGDVHETFAHAATGQIRALAFSPDDSSLAAVSSDRSLKVWDLATKEASIFVSDAHQDRVDSVAYSPDGQTIATGSNARSTKLWDAATGRLLRTWNERDQVLAVSFSPDGAELAATSGNEVRIRDLRLRRAPVNLKHGAAVLCLAISPNNRWLASADRSGRARLWSIGTSAEPERFNDACAVAFAPYSNVIACGGPDGTVKLREIESKQEHKALAGHESRVHSIVFSPDGAQLATAGADGYVRLWDAATLQEHRAMHAQVDGSVRSVAFSPDGAIIASAGGLVVKLWDAESGTLRGTLEGHSREVRCVRFAPDGKLASASFDDTVRVWDVATRETYHTIRGNSEQIWSVAFSPDGRTLAVGRADGVVQLMDTRTWLARMSLKQHSFAVQSMAFCADGRTLVTTGDARVKLWRTATPDEVDNHPDKAIALHERASVQIAQDSTDRVEALLREAMRLQRFQRRGDSVFLARAELNLARHLIQHSGSNAPLRLQEAERMLRDAARIAERHLAPADPLRVKILSAMKTAPGQSG